MTRLRPHHSHLLAVLTLLLAFSTLLLPIPIQAAQAHHQLSLNARTFAFEPARFEVNIGDRVTLTLQSEDVVHGVYIDGYDITIAAEPGKPAQTTFVADRAGKFRFRCSVSCGALHPFMIGELVVGPNLPFIRAAAALLIVFVGN